MNNLVVFLLKRTKPEGMDILGAYTWFPNAFAIAQKANDERAIMQIVAVPLGWNCDCDGQHQIYERRFIDADKRWVETWFDESYKPKESKV